MRPLFASLFASFFAVLSRAPPATAAPTRPDVAVVQTFAVLLALQCLGEWFAAFVRLPIPGPVIGMVLLLGLLSVAPGLERALAGTALGLLNHLSLLFIPVGAGVFALAGALKGQVLAIAVAILVSTTLSVAVTGLVTCALLERQARRAAKGGQAGARVGSQSES